jgi:hypothetical protein
MATMVSTLNIKTTGGLMPKHHSIPIGMNSVVMGLDPGPVFCQVATWIKICVQLVMSRAPSTLDYLVLHA